MGVACHENKRTNDISNLHSDWNWNWIFNRIFNRARIISSRIGKLKGFLEDGGWF